jgi:hypothetical protein
VSRKTQARRRTITSKAKGAQYTIEFKLGTVRLVRVGQGMAAPLAGLSAV